MDNQLSKNYENLKAEENLNIFDPKGENNKQIINAIDGNNQLSKNYEITIDKDNSIIAPKGVTKEQIINAIQGLIPVEQKLKKERESKIRTLVKNLKDKIEEEGSIDTVQRRKRGDVRVSDHIIIEDQYCRGRIDSYGYSTEFKIDIKKVKKTNIDISSDVFTIKVNDKNYTVSLEDINTIHAAMVFLKEHGSRDYDNPFGLSIGVEGKTQDILLKEQITLNPTTILRAIKGGVRFLSNPKSNLGGEKLTKILNEAAIEHKGKLNYRS